MWVSPFGYGPGFSCEAFKLKLSVHVCRNRWPTDRHLPEASHTVNQPSLHQRDSGGDTMTNLDLCYARVLHSGVFPVFINTEVSFPLHQWPSFSPTARCLCHGATKDNRKRLCEWCPLLVDWGNCILNFFVNNWYLVWLGNDLWILIEFYLR